MDKNVVVLLPQQAKAGFLLPAATDDVGCHAVVGVDDDAKMNNNNNKVAALVLFIVVL